MPNVFIDPDGSCEGQIGIIVEYATGVFYEHQCAGVAIEYRSVEGYYVPVGCLKAKQLRKPFHDRKGCKYGPIQNDRISDLRRIVESIGYESEERGRLRLDPERIGEIVEAWVPVLTPDGQRGILTWQNCD